MQLITTRKPTAKCARTLGLALYLLGATGVALASGGPGTGAGTTTANGARASVAPSVAIKPAQATADSPKPGMAVTPTTITGFWWSNNVVRLGDPLEVRQLGKGDPKNPNCGSRITLKRVKGEGMLGGDGYSQISSDTLLWQWPKSQTFVFTTPGTYAVELGVYEGGPGGAAACGYKGPGSIPGLETKFEVIAK